MNQWVWYDAFIRETWIMYDNKCCWHGRYMSVTYIYAMWSDIYVCQCASPKWITQCDIIYPRARPDSCTTTRVAGMAVVGDTTRSYVWHDLFIRLTWLVHTFDIHLTWLVHILTWLVHTFDMTRSYVWHDAFISVTWLVYMYDMTRAHVWCLVHTRDMTRVYTCIYIYI